MALWFTRQLMLNRAAELEPLNRARLQSVVAILMRQTGGPIYTLLSSFDSSQDEFRTINAMVGG